MSLLHAEYLKLSRRKLYPVMSLILLTLVAFTGFFLMAFGQIAPDLAGDIPILSKPSAYIVGAQQVAGQTWFPMILAVVMVGGELGSTVWATALTREPSLLNHVSSRLGVFAIAGWIAFALATAVWGLMTYFIAPGSGGPGLVDWLQTGWRLGLVALVWSSLGLAAVALLRSVGPAIGAVLAFSFLEAILGLWRPYGNVSVTAATTGLFGSSLDGWLGSLVPGSGLTTLHSVVVISCWALAGLGLTWWGLRRRDA
jgi:hypothetical protein